VKRLLFGAVLLIAALGAVLLVNTLRYGAPQVPVQECEPIAVDADAAARRLAQALAFPTVWREGQKQATRTAFEGLHRHLESAFPRVHAALERELVNGQSLLYTWPGTEAGARPVLLMAHQDVVPVDPATASNWQHPPFAGGIADGHVWGRGAIDHKSGVLGILEATEMLLERSFAPARTVYLAFGHDEESGGEAGAVAIAALLRRRGVQLEFVLDEGGVVADGILPGIEPPVALVGIAEKGFVNLELRVETGGGHSSMPPAETANGILARAVSRLERHPMPARLDDGAASLMFERVGPVMPFAGRLVFANLWLFRPLVVRQLAAAPTMNAMVRTTTAVTILEGGIGENVLPTSARAVANFRVLPGDSIEDVINHVVGAVDDPRVRVTRHGDVASEPSPVSSTSAPAWHLLERTIREVFPGVMVAPFQVVTATDSRHYEGVSADVYRFTPVTVGPDDVARIHGIDERIPVAGYAQAIRFYHRLLVNAATPGR
jgi:carboxypeptidase PM20D1